jgi:riboflavin synthase
VFTGIIETMGTIRELQRGDRSVTIGVSPDAGDFTVAAGGSVALDGVCLTLESIRGVVLYFTAVAETLNRTTLGSRRIGERINLERALALCNRLDGHFVLGHVDEVGTIVSDRREGAGIMRTIRVPARLTPFLAEKGSVAVDGISLTVAAAVSDTIDVSLIPFTVETTTMGSKQPGERVNIECDVIARYLARLMTGDTAQKNPDGKSSGLSSGLSSGKSKESSLFDKMERQGF